MEYPEHELQTYAGMTRIGMLSAVTDTLKEFDDLKLLKVPFDKAVKELDKMYLTNLHTVMKLLRKRLSHAKIENMKLEGLFDKAFDADKKKHPTQSLADERGEIDGLTRDDMLYRIWQASMFSMNSEGEGKYSFHVRDQYWASGNLYRLKEIMCLNEGLADGSIKSRKIEPGELDKDLPKKSLKELLN